MHLADAMAEANEIANALHGLRLQSDPRNRVALACFAVAQQHHSAMLLLLANKPPIQATAFALLRPLLEAVLRGQWISHCATDAQVQNFAMGDQRQVDMASVIQALGKKLDDPKVYEVLYKKTWPVVSAYSHTFEHQVQHWLVVEDVAPQYDEEQIAWLLKNASSCMKLCSASIQRLAVAG